MKKITSKYQKLKGRGQAYKTVKNHKNEKALLITNYRTVTYFNSFIKRSCEKSNGHCSLD